MQTYDLYTLKWPDFCWCKQISNNLKIMFYGINKDNYCIPNYFIHFFLSHTIQKRRVRACVRVRVRACVRACVRVSDIYRIKNGWAKLHQILNTRLRYPGSSHGHKSPLALSPLWEWEDALCFSPVHVEQCKWFTDPCWRGQGLLTTSQNIFPPNIPSPPILQPSNSHI